MANQSTTQHSTTTPSGDGHPQVSDLSKISPWSIAEHVAIRIPKELYGPVHEFQKTATLTLLALSKMEIFYQERLTYSWSPVVNFVFANEDHLDTWGGVFSKEAWDRYIGLFSGRRFEMYNTMIPVTKARLQALDAFWKQRIEGGGLLPMAIADFSKWLATKMMFVEEIERRLDRIQTPELARVTAERELIGWPCKFP